MVKAPRVPSSGMVVLPIELVDERLEKRGGQGRDGKRLARPGVNSGSGVTVVGDHVGRTLL